MKTETSTINVSPRFSLRLAPTFVVAAVFIFSVAAQLTYATPGDLYESDSGSGNIYEFTPGGTRSTFASGLDFPAFLAFQPVCRKGQPLVSSPWARWGWDWCGCAGW
jgi:hypothetical protein